MICQDCGAVNEPNCRTCVRCGAALGLAKAATEASSAHTTTSPLQQAYLAYKQEDIETALLECRRLLQEDPNNEEALALLAQLEEKQEHYRAAAEVYERLLAIRPDSVAYRLRLEELKQKADSPSTPTAVPVAPAKNSSMDRSSVVLILATTILMLAAAVAILAYEWGRATQLSINSSAVPPVIALRPTTPIASYAPNPVPPTTSQIPSNISSTTPSPASPHPHEPLATPRTGISSGIINAPSVGAATPHVPLPPAPVHTESAPPSQRIVLPTNDTSDANENTVVIPVSGSATSSNSNAAAPSSGAQSSAVIRVYRANSAIGDSSARSYIAMGQRLQLNGQYDQAIQAYTKALPAAGDDTGFVYQQIALCYQREGKKAEAADNFRQAKAAYQQLLQAGRRVAEAQAGIAACDQGLKLCAP